MTTQHSEGDEIPMDVALAHTRYDNQGGAPTAAARALKSVRPIQATPPAAPPPKSQAAKPPKDTKPDIGTICLDGPDGTPLMIRGRVRLALQAGLPKDKTPTLWSERAPKADEWMAETQHVTDIDELMLRAARYVTVTFTGEDTSTYPSTNVKGAPAAEPWEPLPVAEQPDLRPGAYDDEETEGDDESPFSGDDDEE